jgi:thiol-disulfide isomerase/thioredoxin
VRAATSPRFPLWILVVAGAATALGLALLKAHHPPPSERAPQVSLPLLDGKKQELQSGTVTIVDFWATWCGPCRASMPRVQHVARDYAPKGVALFSIDTDNDGADRDPIVREFLMQNRLDFPVTLDDGSAQEAFKVNSLPTMLVVGKDGRVVWRRVGVLDAHEEVELRRTLDDALAAK